jgi:hypothetical protein
MAYVSGEVGQEIWENIEPNHFSIASANQAPEAVSCSIITNMLLYGFRDGNHVDEIFACFEMPHDYKPGTVIRPHIHWMPDVSAAGNVKWSFSYSIGDDNVPFTTEATVTAVQAAAGANLYHSKEFTPEINSEVINGGSIIMVRLFRNAADEQDTYPGIAMLLSLGIHYQSKNVGSAGVFVSGG